MKRRMTPPFTNTDGPRDAKIALVGEALGYEEVLAGKPFVGSAGKELHRLAIDAELITKDQQISDVCFVTNLISFRPSESSNDFSLLCAKKTELPKDYDFPPIHQGKFLKPEYLGELDRLQMELLQVKPNIIVALGGKASWALLRNSYISKIRGSTAPSLLCAGRKVLPTFHPSYILQGGFSERPIVITDLMKAKRESTYAELRRPERRIIVAPTLSDLDTWVRETLANPPFRISCDIETKYGQIESINFARSRAEAICCPFLDTSYKFPRSFWPTHYEEVEARKLCDKLLSSEIPKVGQNFIYDMQWLLREGFTLRNIADDTMLLHHSIYPEAQKSLGFLGSIYSNEASWKLIRKRNKEQELKRDD